MHLRASVGQAHRHLRHACTRLCRACTQTPSARMHSPLSGRHTGTFGTHARASVGQAQAPSARMHAPLMSRHTGTFGTLARASVGQAHRHLWHACTLLSGRYLRGTLFNIAPWHVYHYPAYTLNGRHTLRSILFSMA